MDWSSDFAISFLSFVGFIASLTGVIASARSISRKRNAEASLVRLIEHHFSQSARLRRQFQLASEREDELFRLYEAEIQRALQSLSETQQHQILQGLEQPSRRGRVNYIRKLIDETKNESNVAIAG